MKSYGLFPLSSGFSSDYSDSFDPRYPTSKLTHPSIGQFSTVNTHQKATTYEGRRYSLSPFQHLYLVFSPLDQRRHLKIAKGTYLRINNEFAAAAFRFGHSMIPSTFSSVSLLLSSLLSNCWQFFSRCPRVAGEEVKRP